MSDSNIHSAEKVAARIVVVREFYNLSQKEFAKEIGVSASQLNDWETGRARLSLKGSLKIYERYKIDPNWFFLNMVDTLPHNIATALSSRS